MKVYFLTLLEKKNASENKDEVDDNVDVDCEHIEGVEQEVYSIFSFFIISLFFYLYRCLLYFYFVILLEIVFFLFQKEWDGSDSSEQERKHDAVMKKLSCVSVVEVDVLRQKKVDDVSSILNIDKITAQALLDFERWVPKKFFLSLFIFPFFFLFFGHILTLFSFLQIHLNFFSFL